MCVNLFGQFVSPHGRRGRGDFLLPQPRPGVGSQAAAPSLSNSALSRPARGWGSELPRCVSRVLTTSTENKTPSMLHANLCQLIPCLCFCPSRLGTYHHHNYLHNFGGSSLPFCHSTDLGDLICSAIIRNKSAVEFVFLSLVLLLRCRHGQRICIWSISDVCYTFDRPRSQFTASSTCNACRESEPTELAGSAPTTVLAGGVRQTGGRSRAGGLSRAGARPWPGPSSTAAAARAGRGTCPLSAFAVRCVSRTHRRSVSSLVNPRRVHT